jgi:hypothetical protein
MAGAGRSGRGLPKRCRRASSKTRSAFLARPRRLNSQPTNWPSEAVDDRRRVAPAVGAGVGMQVCVRSIAQMALGDESDAPACPYVQPQRHGTLVHEPAPHLEDSVDRFQVDEQVLTAPEQRPGLAVAEDQSLAIATRTRSTRTASRDCRALSAGAVRRFERSTSSSRQTHPSEASTSTAVTRLTSLARSGSPCSPPSRCRCLRPAHRPSSLRRSLCWPLAASSSLGAPESASLPAAKHCSD